jgi:hypothetical protein
VQGDKVVPITADLDDVMAQGYICLEAAALADLREDPDEALTLATDDLRAIHGKHLPVTLDAHSS